MKILFDFLPIILFFVTFKFAENHKEQAAAWATEHFGFLVAGGVVGTTEAPVLLSTLVVMVATLAQVVWQLARGRKVEPMLWVSLALVVVLGGATVWFHSEVFIKWKPTLLYGAMAAGLWGARLLGKNPMKSMLGAQLTLPDAVWQKINHAWALFFVVMGGLNLLVAYNYSTETWVNFKLFGSLGLTLIFSLAQGVYLSRHMTAQPVNRLTNSHKEPQI
jgi:intracellular septation protein